jgi:hypothetical protein
MVVRRYLLMYAANSKQAVKMRGLARRLRHDAEGTSDSWYRCQFQLAALDLEAEADRLERTAWSEHELSLH